MKIGPPGFARVTFDSLKHLSAQLPVGLTSLSLVNCRMSADCTAGIASILVRSKRLTFLNLDNNEDFSRNGAMSVVYDAVKDHRCLQTLQVQGIFNVRTTSPNENLHAVHVALTQALSCSTSLTALLYAHNAASSATLQALSLALTSSTCKLATLDLQHCNSGSFHWGFLAELLQKTSSLTKVRATALSPCFCPTIVPHL